MSDIEVRKVEKLYGKTQVVHGIDLKIRKGEFVVILGPSGCGKSTLLRMIAGLERITRGDISIGGRRVNDLEPRERGCAMVFQNYALYPHMSVAGNIGYALKVAGLPKGERDARVQKIAATVGLRDYLERKPAQLSGGQRQRVAMARAMIREPEVFLFDEPLSNLDAQLRVQMRLEIRRLHKRLGATSVFVTHDQIEAMTLADRLVVMNDGRIDQIGTPSEVYSAPATRFVARFIGSPPMNLLNGGLTASGMIRFGLGRELPCPPIDRKWDGSVVFGFRPEDAKLAPLSGRGRTNPGIPFEIELVEDVGVARLCHGEIDGQEIALSIPPGTPVVSGQRQSIVIDPERLHLFDSATGARIPQSAARPADRSLSKPKLEAIA
jgi:sn-glycerol 3-phosphate transport system ATP-binding protein